MFRKGQFSGMRARVEPSRWRTSKTDRIHTMEAAVRLRLVEKVAHFDPHDCEPPIAKAPVIRYKYCVPRQYSAHPSAPSQ